MFGTCSTEGCGRVGTLVTGNGGAMICRTCDLWQGKESERDIREEWRLETATLAANEGCLEYERSLGVELTEAERIWVVDTLYALGQHLLGVRDR